MATLWTAPAKVLVDRAESGWEGIWTLTYAAGLAAINLGSVVPLGVAIDQMASAALGRIATLTATDLPVPELAALSQAGSLLFTGRAWVTGRMP